MDAEQLPTPDEAQASLEQAAQARQATVAATRRPLRLDAGFAAASGLAIGVASIGGWGAVLTGAVVLVVACIGFAILDRGRRRRRGRIVDERALGSYALLYFPLYAVVYVVFLFRPGPASQPWFSLGAGLVVAVVGLVYLRLDDRYQSRRLTAGDYGRYDLL